MDIKKRIIDQDEELWHSLSFFSFSDQTLHFLDMEMCVFANVCPFAMVQFILMMSLHPNHSPIAQRTRLLKHSLNPFFAFFFLHPSFWITSLTWQNAHLELIQQKSNASALLPPQDSVFCICEHALTFTPWNGIVLLRIFHSLPQTGNWKRKERQLWIDMLCRMLDVVEGGHLAWFCGNKRRTPASLVPA